MGAEADFTAARRATNRRANASPGFAPPRLAPPPSRCVTPVVRSALSLSAVFSARRLATLALAATLLVLTGCASVETRKVVDLARFNKIYVEHRLSDDRRVDEMIVKELTRLGYQASHGPLTMLPDHTDAVLTYEDRWEWDFKTYLIELTVNVRTARTNKKLADGRFYQPTPNSKAPAEVVSKVIVPLFAKK